jgi:hypothetical protein
MLKCPPAAMAATSDKLAGTSHCLWRLSPQQATVPSFFSAMLCPAPAAI